MEFRLDGMSSAPLEEILGNRLDVDPLLARNVLNVSLWVPKSESPPSPKLETGGKFLEAAFMCLSEVIGHDVPGPGSVCRSWTSGLADRPAALAELPAAAPAAALPRIPCGRLVLGIRLAAVVLLDPLDALLTS